MSEKLIDAMTKMKEKEALEIAGSLMEGGSDPVDVLNSCTEAMEIIGKKFEAGEYFLPELMMAGEMMSQISEMVKPELKGEQASGKKGKVLMGTVEGDIHDIGKDMVTFLLDTNGFEVRDIGIDAPPSKFIDAIKEFEPRVVGMSGLLTLAYDSMKRTVEAIQEAGLRDKVKIMIGGGQITEKVMEYTGADAYGKDAVEGVNLVRKWILE